VVTDCIYEAYPAPIGELAEEVEGSDVTARSVGGCKAARDDKGLRVGGPYRSGCRAQQVHVLSALMPLLCIFAEHLIPLISGINRIRIVIKASLCVRDTDEINSQIRSNIDEVLAFTIDNIVLRSRKDLAHIDVFTIESRRTVCDKKGKIFKIRYILI
jgi:hypothetical protein